VSAHAYLNYTGRRRRRGYEVATPYTQRDVCTTVGDLLGFSTPQSSGSPMSDVFEPSTTGISQ